MPVSHSDPNPNEVSVLLVDDNLDGCAARKQVLEEMGHRVSIASSAEQALALFEQTPFSLVVTDLRMSGMDGVHLIRSLRELSPDLPVILLSGFAQALGLTEENTGADIVLYKSATEVQQLKRAVSRLLRRPSRKPATSDRRRRSVRKRNQPGASE